MNIEFITKKDFEQFKSDILEMLTESSNNTKHKTWLRSSEVRQMLSISPGTLRNLRINGDIPYTKLGGTLYYDYDQISNILDQNKSK